MKITGVRTATVSIPLREPTRISTRLILGREFVLCWIDTDEGVTGLGYTYGGRLIQAAIDFNLAGLLVGQDPEATERLWSSMFQETLLLGRRGAVLRAIGALDIALWDLKGKLANRPLFKLLGGYRDEVPAYASGGYYRQGRGLDDMRREMERYLALGFEAVKIKVGGAPLDEDVARVKAARQVIGPGVKLALDANNAWREPAEAIKAARAFEPYDIWWLEEPLPPDNIPGHAAIAAALEMPVATGEIEATRWGFRDLITMRGADILQPDACVLGGVSEWIKVANTAASFDLPVAPHWNHDIHVHLMGAVANGLTLEYFLLDEDIYNFERIVAEPLEPGARIRIPDRPGVGLVLDAAAVERYRVG